MAPRCYILCLAVCVITLVVVAQQKQEAPLQSVPASPSALLTPDEFFRRAGSGLRGIEAERRNYWQPHIANSQRRILEAASLCQRHTTALVLGAGNCTEIPLEQLARQFDEVILVDLDADSMNAAIEDLPDDVASKVHVRVQDVTTFAAPVMQRLWQLAANSSSAEHAHSGLETILDTSTAESASKLPEADLIVSSLVLSELHRYPLSYASRLMLDKFGERLSAWSGYERLRARLQQTALQDHFTRIAEALRPGGALYFADTIERGPLYEEIAPEERRKVLSSLYPDLAHLAFFEAIQSEGPLQQTFFAAFSKMRERWPTSDPRTPQSELLEQLRQPKSNSSSADRGPASETIVNLLCEKRFPVDAEIAAFERLLQQYGKLRGSFESLIPLDAVQQEWQFRDLRVSGPAESWWWLEYPCSISYSSGAFQIRSWILRKP